ncbi:MAG: hypothetical protein NZZ41_08075, partial [Candidatus Dojkabacteria bacterium]|nr:hypothetical protein [Candidatus Dojkabacteria bacterium]
SNSFKKTTKFIAIELPDSSESTEKIICFRCVNLKSETNFYELMKKNLDEEKSKLISEIQEKINKLEDLLIKKLEKFIEYKQNQIKNRKDKRKIIEEFKNLIKDYIFDYDNLEIKINIFKDLAKFAIIKIHKLLRCRIPKDYFINKDEKIYKKFPFNHIKILNKIIEQRCRIINKGKQKTE